MSEIIRAISAILDRTNDVRDWPHDEQVLHRGHLGSFDERRADVVALRAEKIVSITRPAGRTHGVDAITEARIGQHYEPSGDVGREKELMDAADCYLSAARYGADGWQSQDGALVPPPPWPWAERYWHPADNAAGNLAIAGGLIAAALDAIAANPQT